MKAPDGTHGASHSLIAIKLSDSLAASIAPGAIPTRCDAQSLSLADVVAVARYGTAVEIDSESIRSLHAGFESLQAKLSQGEVIYGVNTLFGGSANLRTKQTVQLQEALVRELHYGILPEQTQQSTNVSLSETPAESSCIPYTWARAAILIRLNSLLKGYSGVRPMIVERLTDLLRHDIVPIIPLRGSISASGDLSPLSYIAGAIQGKRTIRIYSKTRPRFTAERALAEAKLEPVSLKEKEGLAVTNGTSVSCAVAALALYDAHGLAVLSQAVTAMSVEALRGTPESFDALFSKVRPHPGQTETARNIRHFLDGSKLTQLNEGEGSSLRQDRYSIRTAPQWIGPVLEDLMLAHQQILIECNSVTDNPLVSKDGSFLHGGNFQAKAVTSAMEKTRQGLHTLGRMLYAQCTEMINPATNHGLPPNLVAEDPSASFIFKGTDINIASLLSELGFLAGPVNHIQSAEMSNQSLNSLALISSRYTHIALEVLSQLLAAHLVALCQALDLRALQMTFLESYRTEFSKIFRSCIHPSSAQENQERLEEHAWTALLQAFDTTASLDANKRFKTVAKSLRDVLLDDVAAPNSVSLEEIKLFMDKLAGSLHERWILHREAYLSSAEGYSGTSAFLGRASRQIHKYVRRDLGVPILCTERIRTPPDKSQGGKLEKKELKEDEDEDEEPPTVGYFNSKVYRAIKTGALPDIAVRMLKEIRDVDADVSSALISAPAAHAHLPN